MRLAIRLRRRRHLFICIAIRAYNKSPLEDHEHAYSGIGSRIMLSHAYHHISPQALSLTCNKHLIRKEEYTSSAVMARRATYLKHALVQGVNCPRYTTGWGLFCPFGSTCLLRVIIHFNNVQSVFESVFSVLKIFSSCLLEEGYLKREVVEEFSFEV